jgi:hypothetical protein
MKISERAGCYLNAQSTVGNSGVTIGERACRALRVDLPDTAAGR